MQFWIYVLLVVGINVFVSADDSDGISDTYNTEGAINEIFNQNTEEVHTEEQNLVANSSNNEEEIKKIIQEEDKNIKEAEKEIKKIEHQNEPSHPVRGSSPTRIDAEEGRQNPNLSVQEEAPGQTVEQTTPAVEAPAAEQTEPALEQTEPVVEQTEPAVEVPALEETAQIAQTAAEK